MIECTSNGVGSPRDDAIPVSFAARTELETRDQLGRASATAEPRAPQLDSFYAQTWHTHTRHTTKRGCWATDTDASRSELAELLTPSFEATRGIRISLWREE